MLDVAAVLDPPLVFTFTFLGQFWWYFWVKSQFDILKEPMKKQTLVFTPGCEYSVHTNEEIQIAAIFNIHEFSVPMWLVCLKYFIRCVNDITFLEIVTHYLKWHIYQGIAYIPHMCHDTTSFYSIRHVFMKISRQDPFQYIFGPLQNHVQDIDGFFFLLYFV